MRCLTRYDKLLLRCLARFVRAKRLFMTYDTHQICLGHQKIEAKINSVLQNSFQAAKSQEKNANGQRTAADEQRQSKQHTRVLAF